MYPGDPGDPGGDCAGVVLAAGGCAGVQPGDAVFGLATGSLGSHVVASALTLVPAPANVSAEAAATMPTVFITVDAALNQLAALRPDERLLLPAAAGGVGLAGIQLAQTVGTQAMATAGSPAKRGLLRSLGVGAVAGSRDAACFSDLAVASSRRGADVVLNSLTSPGMVGGALALLRRGGRLVEIGKRDVWSGAAVAAQRPDVSYSLLAVDFMSEAGLHAAMVRLSGRVAAGTARPLPGAVHDLRSAAAALRQLSQARHVGKVVVRASGAAGAAAAAGTGSAAAASAFSPGSSSLSGGAVLVLGGSGTLGSLMVRWLAESGAGAMPVASRSGRLTPALGALLRAGASAAAAAAVTVAACDGGAAADAAALEASLGGRPLLGMLHAGGVLADAVFSNQSAAGVRAVFGPKVQALGLLQQRMLRTQPVASTVLFSSVAALLGAPGQANYSAANAALDAAAGALSSSGLPALSVQWGAWAGAGMAANDPQTAARVERMGMGLVGPQAGLAALEGALASLGAAQQPVVAAAPFRWQAFLRRFSGAAATPALFSAFAAEAQQGAAAGSAAASGPSSGAWRGLSFALLCAFHIVFACLPVWS
jgi:NADPH:quinone reductase-like Zn-dependent oxidoreductase